MQCFLAIIHTCFWAERKRGRAWEREKGTCEGEFVRGFTKVAPSKGYVPLLRSSSLIFEGFEGVYFNKKKRFSVEEKGVTVLCQFQVEAKGVQEFWADSASDSSETEPEEEATNLCLMAGDELHQSDEEEICDLTYEQLFNIFEKIHSFYRKLKKVHASLKLEFLNLEKEHESLRKEHCTIDSDYMKLVDEFDSLNAKHENLDSEHETLLKKYSDLSSEHETLKTSHADLKTAFKELDLLACVVDNEDHYLKLELASSKKCIEFWKQKYSALEKNKPPLLFKDFYKPAEPETFHESSSRHVPFKPRKRNSYQNKLRNPFPGVRCFSCGMLGHISHTCTVHRRTHLVWRPKLHDSQHSSHALHSFNEKEPKQDCSHTRPRESMWYLDSGCSRHMIGDANQFISLEARAGGKVTLGDNTTRKVVGAGIIGNSKNLLIENVLLVDGLKYNLLSISQLCDKGYTINFLSASCIISLNDKFVFGSSSDHHLPILKFSIFDHIVLDDTSHRPGRYDRIMTISLPNSKL
ncbi:hypothetical protein M5K25_024896 [Dendrobium thyrsiflorum]|uniref:CCHC-type domain-containing protein n=1 Tax=Dendrobium thyrsiflorum TaxID=117978 RepID=A0ABD0U3E0_DENTH